MARVLWADMVDDETEVSEPFFRVTRCRALELLDAGMARELLDEVKSMVERGWARRAKGLAEVLMAIINRCSDDEAYARLAEISALAVTRILRSSLGHRTLRLLLERVPQDKDPHLRAAIVSSTQYIASLRTPRDLPSRDHVLPQLIRYSDGAVLVGLVRELARTPVEMLSGRSILRTVARAIELVHDDELASLAWSALQREPDVYERETPGHFAARAYLLRAIAHRVTDERLRVFSTKPDVEAKTERQYQGFLVGNAKFLVEALCYKESTAVWAGAMRRVSGDFLHGYLKRRTRRIETAWRAERGHALLALLREAGHGSLVALACRSCGPDAAAHVPREELEEVLVRKARGEVLRHGPEDELRRRAEPHRAVAPERHQRAPEPRARGRAGLRRL